MNLLVEAIKTHAMELGFDDCRIARAQLATHASDYEAWLAADHHGDMQWMARDPARRSDPRQVLAGCQSIVCLALNYFPGDDAGKNYRIARYAWNDDYHDLIEKRLAEFDAFMQSLGGTQRYYVDTGPILERDFATDAGLGWNGKSTVQIHRKLGTWFFLAELLTTLDLTPDPAFGDHCGKCTRCVTACPTQAIIAPHQVDARRCISYLTIEHRGPIPEEFRHAMGNRIYGCDDCLDACPWNRFASQAREISFHARDSIFSMGLRDFLYLDDDAFRRLFAKSPIKRIKRPRFLRNVCVALGNVGDELDMPALEMLSTDPEPLIAEHARWACQQIKQRINKHPTQG